MSILYSVLSSTSSSPIGAELCSALHCRTQNAPYEQSAMIVLIAVVAVRIEAPVTAVLYGLSATGPSRAVMLNIICCSHSPSKRFQALCVQLGLVHEAELHDVSDK